MTFVPGRQRPAAPSVRIAVLGPLTVTDGDGPLPLGGPKSQQVLASLVAAYPRAVSVQALVDELWPDDPPSTAADVVSTYVSGLRSVLGDWLQSEDGAGGARVGQTVLLAGAVAARVAALLILLRRRRGAARA